MNESHLASSEKKHWSIHKYNTAKLGLATQFKKRGRPSKATKEAEKQAKRALEEKEALVEENLVETLSQRPKRLKK